PEGRSPAELRYLQRRGYDMRCFTSDLLTSAVGGGVQIERERRWLLGDRWRLERASEGDASAPFPTAAALVASLFPGADRSIELDKKNASRLQSARQVHASALD